MIKCLKFSESSHHLCFETISKVWRCIFVLRQDSCLSVKDKTKVPLVIVCKSFENILVESVKVEEAFSGDQIF